MINLSSGAGEGQERIVAISSEHFEMNSWFEVSFYDAFSILLSGEV